MPDITIDGDFGAYLALPATTPAPGLLLLQEVYGVNRFMRRITDYWAEQGFVALCPDIYWRIEPNIQLDPETPGHRAQALAAGGKLDTDRAVKDIVTAIAHLRGLEQCTGKVATSGYCLGGKLAYLTGTRGDADCNVSYYGVGIEKLLDEADRLTSPLLMHFGGIDPWTPEAVIGEINATYGDNPLVTAHVYADTDHAFAREGASADVPAMRELANGRTLEFLREHLG